MALIEVKNAIKTYQMGDELFYAMNDISFEIDQGDFVAIMGASGSGKSTCMNMLGTLDKPNSGSYFLDGVADIVLGTHTHIQTNDAKVLPKGTLYLTDLGMTGPLNGVIGVDPNIIIDRLKDDGKQVFKLHDDGHVQLNGALFDLISKKIKLIHLEK